MLTILLLNTRNFFKRFLQVLLIVIPFLGFYPLFMPQITIGDMVYINPIFPKYEWWQCLGVYFIGINLSGFVVFTWLSLYYTSKRSRNDKILPRLSIVFTKMIVEYLYAGKYKNDKERKALFNKIKYFAKRKIHVEALFIALARIQETVAENHSDAFKELLLSVGLYGRINRFLYSYSLSDRILAMRIISYLRIRNAEFEQRIYKYSDSKNYALRTEAYGALIRLMEGENQLSEFIGSKYNLSLFDINIIVNAVIKNHKMNIDYIDFLSSKLNRKIIVGLMLAKYRYRKGTRSLILILNYIGHEDPLINQLAWDSFLHLVPKEEGVDIIIDRFKKESDDIKKVILRYSHDTNSKLFYKFLQDVISDESILIKVEAMNILFKESFDSILPLIKTDDPEVRMALKEVSDLSINY